jgi:hypothetical protein
MFVERSTLLFRLEFLIDKVQFPKVSGSLGRRKPCTMAAVLQIRVIVVRPAHGLTEFVSAFAQGFVKFAAVTAVVTGQALAFSFASDRFFVGIVGLTVALLVPQRVAAVGSSGCSSNGMRTATTLGPSSTTNTFFGQCRHGTRRLVHAL